MSLSLSPSQEDTLTVLRAFLLAILPDGVEVVQGQDNRVAEPAPDDFVVMTPVRRERLETNVDFFEDAAFVGSIAGDQMTITAVKIGEISLNDQVQGVGVLAGTKVTAFGTGTGGIGTYTVSKMQTVGLTILQLGAGKYRQNTKVTVQLDVHGSNAGDNAQVISTMFRDEYAFSFFQDLNEDIAPLFADDPTQMPFTNEEDQVENRWVIQAEIQVNATVIAPQQFADEVIVGLISVDAEYPPRNNAIGRFRIGFSEI